MGITWIETVGRCINTLDNVVYWHVLFSSASFQFPSHKYCHLLNVPQSASGFYIASWLSQNIHIQTSINTMRVAIAGNGDLARYIYEEFGGHDIVVLTRSYKPQLEQLGVTQFVIDYTLQSLATALRDVEVLISTIGDVSPLYVDVHRTLIQACRKSPKCNRFIPSEFAGDIETYPDQPAFYARSREPIRKLLREQTDLEWTLVSVGWIADYVVPAKNRYIREIGVSCPINLADNNAIIPGTGNEPVDFAWARDVAKALAKLIAAPAWSPYTYMSGEQSSWNEVMRIIRDKYRPDLQVQHLSLSKLVETIRTSTDSEAIGIAEHQILSASHACSLPQDKVQAHRQKYFPGVHFRTLRDGLADLDRDAGTII